MIDEKLTQLDSLIAQEEAITVQSITDHTASILRRDTIEALMQEVTQATQNPYQRVSRLPRLAPQDLVQWAQAVLDMPLAFVVLDTTGLERWADIIRVLVMDANGEVLYHSTVRPGRQTDSPNTRYTGLTQEMLDDAYPLSVLWEDIRRALKGRYVLAYGQDWLQERLDDNAKQYDLTPIHLIGDCLQTTSVQYFHMNYNQKLVDVCNRIGHPLSSPAMAIDRALGQLALVKAMAEGITNVKPAQTDTDLDLKDRPF